MEDLGVRVLLASLIRLLPKLVEEEAKVESCELSAGEFAGGHGDVDWERAYSAETAVDEREVSDTKELFVGGFSFGGGTGGECFEELAANLNTLSDAKREDDEVECFCADPEPLVVAIVFRLRRRGEGESDVPSTVGRVLYGEALFSDERT